MRLTDVIDVSVIQALAEANFKANGMPIGIVDAVDGSVLVALGWQEICLRYHRANPVTLERCRQSDAYISEHLSQATPCEYVCRNGLRDIGIPIQVGSEHLATLFLGQFFYEGEAPDREFFANQARQLGFDERSYLAALDRVPVFSRPVVENILEYNRALARVISGFAEVFQQRLQIERELSAAVRARDDFLSAASHELKTPLTSLQLVVDAIERGIASGRVGTLEAVAAKLPVIRRQMARVVYLVGELLDVSRLGERRLPLHVRDVDLREVVREVVARFDHEIRASGSQVTVHAPAPTHGRWDPSRIDQVVTNLVSNAVKFGAGRPIGITAVARGHTAVLEVADRGIGIAPDQLPKVFERFGSDSAHHYGGLGLGLWIARQLVAAHGGTIEVRSEPGAGSTFTVRLPCDPSARR